MSEIQRTFNINNNQIVYTETGTPVIPKKLKNKTKGTEIQDLLRQPKSGVTRMYGGSGNEQFFSQRIRDKYHPDCDSFYFSFKKDGKPIIAIENGSLYKDGTFRVQNDVREGVRIVNGKEQPIFRSMNIEEANKLIEEFRSHMDELSPRIRRVLNKIKKVTVH